MCAWYLFIPQHCIPYELPFLINLQLDELSLKKMLLPFILLLVLRPCSVMMELSQVRLKSLPVYVS